MLSVVPPFSHQVVLLSHMLRLQTEHGAYFICLAYLIFLGVIFIMSMEIRSPGLRMSSKSSDQTRSVDLLNFPQTQNTYLWKNKKPCVKPSGLGWTETALSSFSPASLNWSLGFRIAQLSANQIPGPRCCLANHSTAWVGSEGGGWSLPLLLLGAWQPWGAVIRCAGQEEEERHHGLSGGGLVRPQSHRHQLHHHGEYPAHTPTSCQPTPPVR